MNLTSGQTLAVSWYSDIFLGVYIFSQQQFAYFQNIFPQASLNGEINPDAASWANKTGIDYEAAGWANKNGGVSYNVTQSGSYVAVITNAMYYGAQVNGSGAFADISYFKENIVYYNSGIYYARQSDNLCLYVGASLIIAGTISTFYFLQKKRSKFE